MSAPRASVTEVGGNTTRVATREQAEREEGGGGEAGGRGGRGGKEERKVVTMAISAPIRNCRRLSGYPFSLTREMSIRFFGYFASENERATGVRAISLPGFFLYTLELCANDVPNISVGPLPLFFPLPALFLPPLIGRSPPRSAMHLLTLAPGPPLVFLTLLFGSCLSSPPPFFLPLPRPRFLDLAVA